MQIYGRGLRRRLAPMLGGDERRLRMAYSLQFSLPGTPVLRYGDEIGMGEDLSLPEREAIRTPMQWDRSPGAGFSTAQQTVRPLVRGGPYGYEQVNVIGQRHDPGGLLHWFERMLHTPRECPEVGAGTFSVVPVDVPRHVLVHRFDAATGIVVFLHSLSAEDTVVDLGEQPGQAGDPLEVFSDADYGPLDRSLRGLALNGYGFRWIRLSWAFSPM
jgi:maltose alpha-D-glucosyltransferase/alpha-amylase